MRSVSKTPASYLFIFLLTILAFASCSKKSDQSGPDTTAQGPQKPLTLPPLTGGSFTFLTAAPSLLNTYSVNLMYAGPTGSQSQILPVPLNQYSATSPVSFYPVTSAILYGTHGETLAKCDSIVPDNHSWITRQMVDTNNVPQGYWIAWNPKADAVVIMDQDITIINPKPTAAK